MKALSLWQPWASLIAMGLKEYETRHWSTSYRGSLVIHAAKRSAEAEALSDAIYKLRPSDVPEMHTHSKGSFNYWAITGIYRYHKLPVGAFIPKLPLGQALCVVDLVDCIQITGGFRVRLSPQEIAFGDFTPGRYAWKIANVRQFPDPIPMKGAQGLFECALPLPKLSVKPSSQE